MRVEREEKVFDGVTNDHIDEIYDVATKNGACGKLMGAGGGFSFL